MKLKPSTGDYRQHKAGEIYQAHIVNIEVGDGDYGEYFKISLAGDVEDGTALIASATLSAKSKFGKWVALIFPDYDFSTELDTDLLLGQPVAVTFEHTKQDDGGWKEKGTIVARGKGGKVKVDPKDAPF